MVAGFTGTKRGMAQRQRATYRYLLRELNVRVLHHGDCIGADAEADKDARRHGAQIVIHPPSDPKLRAFCDWSLPHEARPPRPYLERNKDIVAEAVDGLLAAPRQMVEPANLRGEGTWTTVGYARRAGRRTWIIWPDGTFREELP
jgi:hypothetical protein